LVRAAPHALSGIRTAQTHLDRRDEALRLNNVGLRQLNRNQVQEALQMFEQVLVIYRGIGESLNGDSFASRQSEGTVLNNIGEVYRNLGQYADAEKTLFAAIEVLESLRLGLPDASKIAIFEMQAFTYRFLPLRHYKMSKGNI